MTRFPILLLLFTLSSCSGLRTQAQIAVAVGPLIDSAGAAIEDEQRADLALERAKNDPATLSERVSALREQFNPVVGAYEEASAAFGAFVQALVAASAHGDDTLGEAYLRGILESWLKLEAAGSKIGVAIPKPPQLLLDEVGTQ